MNLKKKKRTASITILPRQQEHRSCQFCIYEECWD